MILDKPFPLSIEKRNAVLSMTPVCFAKSKYCPFKELISDTHFFNGSNPIKESISKSFSSAGAGASLLPLSDFSFCAASLFSATILGTSTLNSLFSKSTLAGSNGKSIFEINSLMPSLFMSVMSTSISAVSSILSISFFKRSKISFCNGGSSETHNILSLLNCKSITK